MLSLNKIRCLSIVATIFPNKCPCKFIKTLLSHSNRQMIKYNIPWYYLSSSSYLCLKFLSQSYSFSLLTLLLLHTQSNKVKFLIKFQTESHFHVFANSPFHLKVTKPPQSHFQLQSHCHNPLKAVPHFSQ